MKKIVIATDYSAEANNAANYAAAIASEQGHQLILFNLTQISIHALNARVSASVIDEMLEIYDEKLTKAATALSTAYKVKVVPHFATGDFYEELVRCINEHKADVVVMGMASKSIEQDLLGNTTTKAIHRLEFPILAVPLGATYHGFKNVLFACDIDRGVQENVLKNLHSLSVDFGSSIEIFHVETKMSELRHEEVSHSPLGQGLSDISYAYKDVQSPRIIQAIKQEMEDMNADLLVMVPYKYGFWSSIVHRSKTRMMASGSKVPLLSLPF